MKPLILLTLFVAVSCGKDSLKVIHNNDRVGELERRANLNDQLDAMQTSLIRANSEAILVEQQIRENKDLLQDIALNDEIQSRVSDDLDLANLLDVERQARIDGDLVQAQSLANEISARIQGDSTNSQELATAVTFQALRNLLVQGQLASINYKINSLRSRMEDVEDDIDNLDNRLSSIEPKVSQLQSDLDLLSLTMNARIDDIEVAQVATQAQLDQQGVQVFKCDSITSTERMFKINGKFYATMNRVKTEQIQVITGSTSQSFSNPKLCNKGNKTKLPNGSGDCPNNWTTVGGNSVTVPAYSTDNKIVVTEVNIALDILTNGNYATTDGGTSCTFSINNGSSTNLVPVQ